MLTQVFKGLSFSNKELLAGRTGFEYRKFHMVQGKMMSFFLYLPFFFFQSYLYLHPFSRVRKCLLST